MVTLEEKVKCSYLIEGKNIDFCHRAMYENYKGCGYLVNKKQCSRYKNASESKQVGRPYEGSSPKIPGTTDSGN
jgi:hypothetical protein